jgi:hypothetical protein
MCGGYPFVCIVVMYMIHQHYVLMYCGRNVIMGISAYFKPSTVCAGMQLSGRVSYMTLATQVNYSCRIKPPVFMQDMTVLLVSQDIATCSVIRTSFCPR